jgi:bla regulator protein blaR1
MIPKYLSAMWAAIAPAAGNHLWQSTLCLAIAGLLTLVLRKNRARARYGLWLAASVKFLIPFSLLVGIGSHLAWRGSPAGTKVGLYAAMEEVSQPFTQAATPAISTAAHSTISPSVIHPLLAIFAVVWLCGFLAVLSVWYARWRRISAAMRQAVPLREGREVETLRRLERTGGVRKPVELLLSPATLEPGIFGIVQPLLVWPEGISVRLTDAHLEAILAHEVWHVRRRDNLAALIHMVVEAIFWFHPLVWWLGARLVEERERACDEEVLQSGSEPRVYAESILKACEFCVESPLACVAGVTGSDLKERMVRIMAQRSAAKLSFGRKLLLAAFVIAAIGGPVVFGLLNSPQLRAQSTQTTAAALPSFEVASIKPNRAGDMRIGIMIRPGRFTTTGATTKLLIGYAYNAKDFQISGGPSWINSDKYDIDAKEEDSVVAELEKLPPEQRADQIRLMVRSLLADRFKLTLSHETKELPVYALVVAKNGPKLHETKPEDTYPNGTKNPDGSVQHPGMGMMRFGGGQLTGQGVPIENLVHMLSQQLGRDVLDQTGLKGKYDFTLQWTPDQSQRGMFGGPKGGAPGPDSPPPPDPNGPSIFTALQEQLGLKLESTKGPVEILIIDHVEKPSEN